MKLGQFRSLRTGLPSNAVAQPAVYVDVTPYDLSLIQCILQYNTQAKSSLPQGMVLSVIFAKDDSGADNRKGIQNWILGNTVRLVERLNIAGYLQLPGFERRDLVTATVRPTYNEDDYMIMPLGEASLPVRQSWLDSSDAKFTKCQEQFHALIKEHNDKFNPSQVPFSKKRTASQANLDAPAPLVMTPIDKKKSDLEGPLVEISKTGYLTCPKRYLFVDFSPYVSKKKYHFISKSSLRCEVFNPG